jgi:hypothetical protein
MLIMLQQLTKSLFCYHAVRGAGNVLLVVAYKQNYKNTDIAEWGYICQGLGYTFFISATLAFYQRAKDPEAAMMPSPGKGIRSFLANPSAVKGLHLITLIGLILLITGYTDSNGIFPSSTTTTDTTATLDIKAKIGDLIFVGVTAVIAGLTLNSMRNSQSKEATRIFQFILLALPFMAVRIIYVTYESFSKNPFHRTLWIKVLFDFAMEVIVVLIYFVLGFVMDRLAAPQNMEMGTGYKPSYDGRESS